MSTKAHPTGEWWAVCLVDTSHTLPDGTHPVLVMGEPVRARPGDKLPVPRVTIWYDLTKTP